MVEGFQTRLAAGGEPLAAEIERDLFYVSPVPSFCVLLCLPFPCRFPSVGPFRSPTSTQWKGCTRIGPLLELAAAVMYNKEDNLGKCVHGYRWMRTTTWHPHALS